MIVKYQPHHLEQINIHNSISFAAGYLTKDYANALAMFPSYTCIANGIPIACAGIYALGVNRYHAWGFFDKRSGKNMLEIVRQANDFFELSRFPRVEAHVRSDFKQGIKFIEALRFNRETPEPMKNFGDDGKDYYLYSRLG